MKRYAFDGISEQLELVPLAARRALDHVGCKLSRSAWLALPLDTRNELVCAGAAPGVPVDQVRALLASASPAPEPVAPSEDPSPHAPSDDVAAVYATHAKPIEPARWAALSPLDRYALAKVARSSRPERVQAAYQEILGSPEPPEALVCFDLRETELSIDEVFRAVAHAGAGGVSVFVGTVRDHNEGRAVTRLEYEAYTAMAMAEMARIGRAIAREIPGVRLAVTHRVGPLAVGDLAVVCAASAPHRAEAFAACRALIDQIKARVPIWKREHGPEGPYWVGWHDARCVDHAEHTHDHAKG